MNLLLDTCTFLWVVSGDAALSKAAGNAIRDEANAVYLSPVSAWEIAVKHSLGRLELVRPPDRFVPEARALHGIAELPLTELAVLYLPRLPAAHRDPFDRMLVCQALAGGHTIVSPDPLLSAYPVPLLW